MSDNNANESRFNDEEAYKTIAVNTLRDIERFLTSRKRPLMETSVTYGQLVPRKLQLDFSNGRFEAIATQEPHTKKGHIENTPLRSHGFGKTLGHAVEKALDGTTSWDLA